MSVTMSYLTPASSLTLAERRTIIDAVDYNLQVQADKLSIAGDLVVRDTLPDTDLGLAATRDWLVAGLGIAGTELAFVNFAVPVDHVIGYYGVALLTAGQGISVTRFALGATQSQVKSVVQVEQLDALLEPVGYLNTDLYYKRNDVQWIGVMPRRGGFAANSQRVVLLSRVLEPFGTTVSAAMI